MLASLKKLHNPPDTYVVKVWDIPLPDETPVAVVITHEKNPDFEVSWTKRVNQGRVEFTIDDSNYRVFSRDFGSLKFGETVDIPVDDGNTPPDVINLRIVG